MASQVCWGIEVGAGAVKAVKLERSGDGVNVLDFALIPHKRVLSTPDIDEKEAKRLALGALVANHDLKGASLAISVPGHSTFARFAKLPPVEPKKIPDIVKFEAVQQIPFPIDDVEWDYQTFAAPDSPDVEVGIFAITRDKVMDKLAKWQDVGFTPDVLTLSPLAAYNALAYDMSFTEQTPGTVILDIGTTCTDLIVAESGRLWIRTFPIGGHQFTEALVTAFNLSYPKAEKLKREAESTQHARHVLQAMRPVFGDLAQDVQRSIGYYQSLHRDAKLTRLIGLGATFNLPGLRKFLSQQLQIEVARLEGFQRVKVEGKAPPEKNAEFQANSMLYATAVGCALQGLGMETIAANLMPTPVIRQAVWARKTPWFVAAGVVAMIAGAASFVRPMMDKAALTSNTKPPEIDQIKQEAKALKAKWTGVEGEYKPDTRASGAMLLLQRREIFAFLTADLGEMLQGAQTKSEQATPPSKIRFQRFDTVYSLAAGAVAGTGDESAPVSDQAGADDRGGRGGPAPGGGRGGRGGAPPAPPPPPAPTGAPGAEGGDSKPRIHAALEIATTKSAAESDRFVNDTLQKWLHDNAERDAVPYTIDHASVKWRKLREEKVPERPVDPSAASGGGAPAPGGDAGGGRPGSGRPGRGGAPGAGGGNDGGGAPAGGGQGPTPRVDDPNKVAPIKPPEALGPPGSPIQVYVIEWDAVLKPAEGEAAKKEGAQ